jgi:hypothetical protein
MKSFSYLVGTLAGTRVVSASPFLTALILAVTARRFHRGTPRPSADRKRIIFLPKTLFKEDLVNVFHSHDAEYELWYVAREPLRRVANAYLPKNLSEYDYRSVDDDVTRRKTALRAHWEATLKIFKAMIRPSAFVTCAYYYREEREFAAASLANQIPFIALHKECITTPVSRVARQEVYGRMSGQFTGTLITTYNEDEKRTIVAAGCAEPEIIDVVGCPRMDRFFRAPDAVKGGRAFDVVLFSFSKSTYLPIYRKVPRWPACVDGTPISPWNWSELYDRYHAFALSFARAHPSLRIALKVKTGFDISDVVRLGTGNDALPVNLEIISSGEGGSLAASANVVCGFNSTVLLEALAAKTPVVVPAFAEAQLGSRSEQYGTLRLGNAVVYAAEEGALERFLAERAARAPNRHRPFTEDERTALERYIRFVDGRSGERMRNSITRAITRNAPAMRWSGVAEQHNAGSR